MKILFLSQRFLMPMDTGGKIRTGNILKKLTLDHDITVISNVEHPKDDPYLADMAKFCSRFVEVPWQETRRYSLRFFVRLLAQMFSSLPVTVLNTTSDGLRKAVECELRSESYDIAICDFVQSALEFRNVSQVPTLLFQHNVESMIAQRHVEQASSWFERLFWKLQYHRLFRFERDESQRFSTIIAVSDDDRESFERLYGHRHAISIPTGVDIEFFEPRTDVPENTNELVFCGSMDWLPNEDGVSYFLKDIYPTIRERLPDVTLTVVGRSPTPSLQKLASRLPGVTLTGWVEDTRPYLARCAAMVVPLRIGGGTRMKIYEAMAMGKTVISTPIGAEGLELSDDHNAILEEDPLQFASRTIELLMDVDKRRAIEKAARSLVAENYSWDRVAARFGQICAETADGSPRTARAIPTVSSRQS